jgi:hypothetical protein
MERAASQIRDGEVRGFERVSAVATAELAYIVEIERAQAKVGGAGEPSATASLDGSLDSHRCYPRPCRMRGCVEDIDTRGGRHGTAGPTTRWGAAGATNFGGRSCMQPQSTAHSHCTLPVRSRLSPRRAAFGAAALFLLAQLAIPVPSVGAQTPPSGCQFLNELNDTFATGVSNLDPVQFLAGDQLRFEAGPPDMTPQGPIRLELNGSEVASTPYPGTLTYTIQTTGTYDFFVSIAQGRVTWQFACTPAPDTMPPDTSITAQPATLTTSPTATFSFTGTDDVTAPTALTFACALDGAMFTSCTSPTSYPSLADGSHTFQVQARDAAGNIDPTPASFTWRVDRTPPAVSCNVSPNQLWPPNHQLVPVSVTVTATDAASMGPVAVTLLSVMSTEPENGLGDGDTAGDIQGWSIGTNDQSGQLRAERAGGGNGRVYTFTYRATDTAGNSATTTCTVTVPHNRGS